MQFNDWRKMMGCDIHFVKEKKYADKWHAVYCSDEGMGKDPQISERNYAFFRELAGVRGKTETSCEPRGFPEDISDTTKIMFEEFGDHTPSWATAREFADAYNRAYDHNPQWVKWYNPEEILYEVLGIWSDEEPSIRFVFWFDN